MITNPNPTQTGPPAQPLTDMRDRHPAQPLERRGVLHHLRQSDWHRLCHERAAGRGGAQARKTSAS